MEVLAVRRKKAEIEDEKKAQDERRKARQQKKASKQAAVLDVADFENDMAIDDKAEKTKFPRNLTEGAYLGNWIGSHHSHAPVFSEWSKAELQEQT